MMESRNVAPRLNSTLSPGRSVLLSSAFTSAIVFRTTSQPEAPVFAGSTQYVVAYELQHNNVSDKAGIRIYIFEVIFSSPLLTRTKVVLINPLNLR